MSYTCQIPNLRDSDAEFEYSDDESDKQGAMCFNPDADSDEESDSALIHLYFDTHCPKHECRGRAEA